MTKIPTRTVGQDGMTEQMLYEASEAAYPNEFMVIAQQASLEKLAIFFELPNGCLRWKQVKEIVYDKFNDYENRAVYILADDVELMQAHELNEVARHALEYINCAELVEQDYKEQQEGKND